MHRSGSIEIEFSDENNNKRSIILRAGEIDVHDPSEPHECVRDGYPIMLLKAKFYIEAKSATGARPWLCGDNHAKAQNAAFESARRLAARHIANLMHRAIPTTESISILFWRISFIFSVFGDRMTCGGGS
jgi:hypothetical protein